MSITIRGPWDPFNITRYKFRFKKAYLKKYGIEDTFSFDVCCIFRALEHIVDFEVESSSI